MSEAVTIITTQHRSPGLTAIFNEVKGSSVNHVLDLGPSSAKNFNFFTQLSCKIRFENFSECLADQHHERLDSETLIASLEQYLNDLQAERDTFDLILTWDIFNYLDLAGVQWLMRKLSTFCRPGALIHTIKYVSQRIPVQPQEFQILNQYQLQILQAAPLGVRRHASHDTARLLKQIADFYMERSYLNHEGMVPGLVEHVLRFQPDKSLAARRQSSEELTETTAPDTRQTHKSTALAAAFKRLEIQRPTLLDLGQKNRNNTDLFHSITPNIYTEDLYQEFQLQIKNSSHAQIKPHMLNFAENVKFDLVLLWDLLNFLDSRTMEDLFNRLEPQLADKAIIHAIIYSGRETPAAPQSFFLRNFHELDIVTTAKKSCAEPLTSSRLLKFMRVFRLEETFVFQPGMQRGIYEYLFRRL